MSAIKDLFGSERGLLCLVLIISSTVLTALGHISYTDWREYTLYIFGTYVVGKTATGVATIMRSGPAAPAPQPAPAPSNTTIVNTTTAS